MVQRTYTLYILLIIILSAFLTLRGKQPKEPLFIITGLGTMLAPIFCGITIMFSCYCRFWFGSGGEASMPLL